jgi:hypothetical protein
MTLISRAVLEYISFRAINVQQKRSILRLFSLTKVTIGQTKNNSARPRAPLPEIQTNKKER